MDGLYLLVHIKRIFKDHASTDFFLHAFDDFIFKVSKVLLVLRSDIFYFRQAQKYLLLLCSIDHGLYGEAQLTFMKFPQSLARQM